MKAVSCSLEIFSSRTDMESNFGCGAQIKQKLLYFKKLVPELLRILLVLNPVLFAGPFIDLNSLFRLFSLFILSVSLKYYQTCFCSSSIFYLLLSSSQRFRCFEWAHQCSRQRYCLKLSMNPVPLNIIEWHLFLLVVSALTNWFLSDWQLGLHCSRRTAAWAGDCSQAGLCLCLICLECIYSDWSNLHGPQGLLFVFSQTVITSCFTLMTAM